MTHPLLNWVRASWDAIRTSLWLLPAFMFLIGIALAVVMLRLATSGPGGVLGWAEWHSGGNGEDARNLLSTLLGAVIGMASIVFSITVVSLSLAANSYGPRLIRTFRFSRSTQVVIGIFIMTIVYLLLVLRAVRGDSDAGEVPQAAVAVGSLLALMSVLALLSFIQGVATLMVADEVVRRVRKELDTAIDKLPPLGERGKPAKLPSGFEERAGRIRLPREGYVQSVDSPTLSNGPSSASAWFASISAPGTSWSKATIRCSSTRPPGLAGYDELSRCPRRRVQPDSASR